MPEFVSDFGRFLERLHPIEWSRCRPEKQSQKQSSHQLTAGSGFSRIVVISLRRTTALLTFPLGQRTSTSSIAATFPSPKCNRDELWPAYPFPPSTSRISV